MQSQTREQLHRARACPAVVQPLPRLPSLMAVRRGTEPPAAALQSAALCRMLATLLVLHAPYSLPALLCRLQGRRRCPWQPPCRPSCGVSTALTASTCTAWACSSCRWPFHLCAGEAAATGLRVSCAFCCILHSHVWPRKSSWFGFAPCVQWAALLGLSAELCCLPAATTT